MDLHSVMHLPHDPMAYPIGQDEIELVLRAGRGDLSRVTLAFTDRYSPRRRPARISMAILGHDSLFEYWTARMRLKYGRFQYYFILDDGNKAVHYGEGGFAQEVPKHQPWAWCFHYPYVWWHPEIDNPPAWARDAVVYQIFVDRFADGDRSNNPPGAAPWGARPTPHSFAGGDLSGIQSRLQYISSLGVSCLYLTPVFLAPSNHKYDTTDYFAIDPAFGDENAAFDLVRACHERGIRVMLDAVFNHCGWDFFAFKDVRENGERSPYASWFNIHEFPVRSGPKGNYETFGTDVWQMPKLRTDNPEVREHLISAAEHWTRELRIDGWRLDVGDDVDPGFWREFRKRIRAIDTDALIVGEVLHDATPFLRGDQMDSIMNYPWREACLAFFARRDISPAEFSDRLTSLQVRYRAQVWQALWNLLGSHDRPRILTMCGGDARRVALAAMFQFTCAGAPYVYYGDEVGIEGLDDPDCRRCMPWDEASWNTELLAHFRALAALRKRFTLLRRGRCITLIAGESALAYARWDSRTCMIVAMNNSDERAEIGLKALDESLGAATGSLAKWAGRPLQALYSYAGASLEKTDGEAWGGESGGQAQIALPAMSAILLRVV
ncbi:MAG: glycoside hydrolase family 13 protein [Clostridia bacterium]|nr:glycoside hydrolase family 13 protein [Clostridia bacterium]